MRALIACVLVVHAALAGCERAQSDEPHQGTVRSPAEREAPVAARPSALAQALALPPLQRARLDYLFEAGERLGGAWPTLAGAPPCVVLIARDVQWAVGCERAPFAQAVQLPDRMRGSAVYARPGTVVTLAGRTVPVAEWLAQVAASTLLVPETPVPPPDRLPAGRAVVAVGTLEAIVALHPDFRDCATDEWLSVALHEWLHAWQLTAPAFAHERRALDDGTLTLASLRALYERDAAFRGQVQREYRLLERAARGTLAAPAARRALRDWSALHRTRAAQLCARTGGAALLRADRVFTYLEGLGRYVESRCLVDPTTRPARILAGDPEFRSFARYANGGYAAMQNRQLDADYPYAIGFHLALLLDRIDPTWRQRVHLHEHLLVGVAGELAAGAEPRASLQPPPSCR